MISVYIFIDFHNSELNSLIASITVHPTDKAILNHLLNNTCISFHIDKSKSISHFTKTFQSSVKVASFQIHISEKILSPCSTLIGIHHSLTESCIHLTAFSENLSQSLSSVASVAIPSIFKTLEDFSTYDLVTGILNLNI